MQPSLWNEFLSTKSVYRSAVSNNFCEHTYLWLMLELKGEETIGPLSHEARHKVVSNPLGLCQI
jgi:hypothetical protein